MLELLYDMIDWGGGLPPVSFQNMQKKKNPEMWR